MSIPMEELLTILTEKLGNKELALDVIQTVQNSKKIQTNEEALGSVSSPNEIRLSNDASMEINGHGKETTSESSSGDENRERLESNSPALSVPSSGCASESSSASQPFPVNSRGRKRIYTDEQRRLRKNMSSKKSRDKHTRQAVMQKQELMKLESRRLKLIQSREDLAGQITSFRRRLCDGCLGAVQSALKCIESGQQITVMKTVHRQCPVNSRFLQEEEQRLLATSIKQEPPSEFTE